STIYDIKAQKDELLTFFAQSETKEGLEKCHKLKLEQLDKALNEWFALKSSEGHPISGPVLVEKAKDFYKQMELTEPCAFSEGWLQCFKLRRGIRRLDVSGEKESAGHEAAESYCESFKKLVSENENLRKLNKPEDSKVILLLDNYRVHPSETDLVSEDEVEEWANMNNNAEVTYSPSDAEIIEKVYNPE
uniref:HTH CENPB-type domain-containing protein n=1 Tax=Pelodiscus sinensis TaxID=13735 RepID=K7GEB1_PELSI